MCRISTLLAAALSVRPPSISSVFCFLSFLPSSLPPFLFFVTVCSSDCDRGKKNTNYWSEMRVKEDSIRSTRSDNKAFHLKQVVHFASFHSGYSLCGLLRCASTRKILLYWRHVRSSWECLWCEEVSVNRRSANAAQKRRKWTMR